MKIPAFLNCTLIANATTVLYDNLTLKDVSGKLIERRKVTLENVKHLFWRNNWGKWSGFDKVKHPF
jgi:hypothetical protein